VRWSKLVIRSSYCIYVRELCVLNFDNWWGSLKNTVLSVNIAQCNCTTFHWDKTCLSLRRWRTNWIERYLIYKSLSVTYLDQLTDNWVSNDNIWDRHIYFIHYLDQRKLRSWHIYLIDLKIVNNSSRVFTPTKRQKSLGRVATNNLIIMDVGLKSGCII